MTLAGAIGTVLCAAGVCGVLHAQTKPATAARSQWGGIYTEAQARRGEPLYAENCAYCHGADLQGTQSAPPLSGAALAAKWNDRPLANLFEYQQVFMPMNSPGGFSRQQNADILAFMFKRGGFPPGPSELPAQPESQRQIRISAARP